MARNKALTSAGIDPGRIVSDTGQGGLSRALQQQHGIKMPAMHKEHEHQEQAAVIRFSRDQQTLNIWPELEFLHAIPNAAKRGKRERGKMLAEGLKAGMPDLCLPCPRGIYHGLYIEMKHGRNQPTANQKDCIKFLRQQGYFVDVCWCADEAIGLLKLYMRLKPKDTLNIVYKLPISK